MQRSKQQAMTFLLGAVLVGGVLGFSADRVMRHKRFAADYGPRAQYYDELGLSGAQRARIDSLLADNICAIQAVQRPVQTEIDSLHRLFNEEFRAVLTPAQRAKDEAHHNEVRAARAQAAKENPRKPCSTK